MFKNRKPLQTCTKKCSYVFEWFSQPYSRRLAIGNLVVAAAAFFTSCSPTKLIRLLRNSSIACFGATTYNNIQASYLLPAVRSVWTACQEQLFRAREHRAVKIAGDGRCDSPGHCAKYGSYTMMDAETSEVLFIKLVQVCYFC